MATPGPPVEPSVTSSQRTVWQETDRAEWQQSSFQSARSVFERTSTGEKSSHTVTLNSRTNSEKTCHSTSTVTNRSTTVSSLNPNTNGSNLGQTKPSKHKTNTFGEFSFLSKPIPEKFSSKDNDSPPFEFEERESDHKLEEVFQEKNTKDSKEDVMKNWKNTTTEVSKEEPRLVLLIIIIFIPQS